MHLPTLADYAVFGAWDGVLLSAWWVVAGALCRTAVRIFRRAGSTDPTLRTAFAAGTVVMAIAAAAGIASWAWLPHHAPGVWGVLGIGGILFTYVSMMQYVGKSFQPKKKG